MFATRPVLMVSLATSTLFLLLCAFRLHGFSITAWHHVIDRSPQSEIVLGKARGVRADDWSVMLPLAFAQDAQRPPFSSTSSLVAYGGIDTLVGHPVPVRSWVSAFRPQIWGYFLGRDFGMAWHWWFRFLALFYGSFLVVFLLTEGALTIALCIAAALTFAPFFQFWSFSCEPLLAMAFLSFRGGAGIARSESGRARLAWAALLAWSSACFCLAVIYPPFQLSLAWLFAIISAGWIYAERARILELGRLSARVAAAGAALLFAACALALFSAQHRDAIAILRATVYPGQRSSSGGELPLTEMFNSLFTCFLGDSWWTAFSNISDSGAFFFVLPLVGAVVAMDWLLYRRRPHPVLLVLTLFWILAAVYALVGVPRPLASLVLAGRVSGQRMLLPLGVADLLGVAVFLSESSAEPARSFLPGRLVSAALWTSVLGACGLALAARIEGASALGPVLLSLAFLAVAVPLALRWREAAVALAVLSIAGTFWFNPLVRRGAEFLGSNPFSERVLELDRAAGGRTRWIVYNDGVLAGLLPTLGVQAVNGVHYYPQIELWSRLGLAGRGEQYERVYNRYAHVTFELPGSDGPPSLALPHPDWVSVRVHPDQAAFHRLDVDYLVYVAEDRSALDSATSLEWVTSVGDKHIFRVRRP